MTSLVSEHGKQCMPCSSRIMSKMLPEIHTMEKSDFLKLIIQSQITEFSVISVLRSTESMIGSGRLKEISS